MYLYFTKGVCFILILPPLYLSSSQMSSEVVRCNHRRHLFQKVMAMLFRNYHYDLFIFDICPITNNLSSNSAAQASLHRQIPTDSIRTVAMYSSKRNLVITTKRHNFWKRRKHSCGNLQVYVLSTTLACFQDTHLFMKNVMDTLRKGAEWTNDFVFIFDSRIPASEKIEFYMSALSQTFVRGLTFDIESSSEHVNLVCNHCHSTDVLTPFDINTNTVQQQVSYHRSVKTSQLYGGYVMSGNKPKDSQLISCNFLKIPVEIIKYMSLMCFHLFLTRKLNYTLHMTPSSTRKMYHKLLVADTSPVHPRNQMLFSLTRKFEWISFGLKFDKFHFLRFQRPPSGNVLTKPYDWIVWIYMVLGAGSLAIVTIIWQSFQSAGRAKRDTIIMSILATMCDQAVSNIFTHRVVFGSEMLPCLWFLWVFMMIVFTNGYKGVLFGLITNGETLTWPASLQELVSDSYYCAVTGEYLRHKGVVLSIFRNMLINPAINGNQGSSNIREKLKKLNKSLHFVEPRKDQFGAEREIVENNAHQSQYFKIGNQNCLKFALVENDPREEGIFINYFLPNTVAGRQKAIAGHLTLWPLVIERNFFHERFISEMAALDASGMLKAAERHLKSWYLCKRIFMCKYEITKLNNTLRELLTCVQKVTHSFRTNEIWENTSSREAKPIRLWQIEATMKTFLIGFAIGLTILIFERVGKLKSHQVMYRSDACQG